MAFTYSPAKGDTRSQIRAVLSDTDAANPLKADDEYDGWLSLLPDWAAAAQLARQIAGDFARKVSSFSSAGGIGVAWRERQQHYEQLAAALESRKTLTPLPLLAVPLAGGITDPVTGADIVPFFSRTRP